MTVKDVCAALKTAKTIHLAYGANAVEFDPKDMLQISAFGNFVVDEIRADGDHYEIGIAVCPLKEAENA